MLFLKHLTSGRQEIESENKRKEKVHLLDEKRKKKSARLSQPPPPTSFMNACSYFWANPTFPGGPQQLGRVQMQAGGSGRRTVTQQHVGQLGVSPSRHRHQEMKFPFQSIALCKLARAKSIAQGERGTAATFHFPFRSWDLSQGGIRRRAARTLGTSPLKAL